MPQEFNPTLDELLFTSASDPVQKALAKIDRSALSIGNRLRSIELDSKFIERVAAAYDRPLIANERCGSWYVDPCMRRDKAYFKSTDGHTGEWTFSSRRLNLHIVDAIVEGDGCIIVDSTRRGKSMPDALSKTIPIWCAVLNHAIFHTELDVQTPVGVVSDSEHQQITEKLDDLSSRFLKLDMNLEQLRANVTKPLVPLFVTQLSDLPEIKPDFGDIYPIILCTASKQLPSGEIWGNEYIQGAGDDSEGWARGLSSSLFWENKTILLKTQEPDLPAMVDSIVGRARPAWQAPTLIKPTTGIFIASLKALAGLIEGAFCMVIYCTPNCPTDIHDSLRPSLIHLKCNKGKLGSRDLRKELARADQSVQERDLNDAPILVVCDSGKDLAVGVALMILCKHLDEVGKPRSDNDDKNQSKIDKTFIMKRLSWITASVPDANPTRSTLQAVNSYLMTRPL